MVDVSEHEAGNRRNRPVEQNQIARLVRRMAEETRIRGATSSGGMARDLVTLRELPMEVQLAGGWRSPELAAHRAWHEPGSVARNFLNG